MKQKLSAAERNILQNQHRRERNGKVRDRIKAVLAYDNGYTYSEIAQLLLLDDETIRRHVEDYLSKKKLKPENGGSQSKLTSRESSKLVAHIQEKTYLYVKDICFYVKQTFKKIYSVSGMRHWLRANSFSYKKPHAVPAKADKIQQAAFVQEYEKIKAAAGDDEPIYFADSVHPQHQTRLAYGWIFKGERKAIATTGRQYRVNYMGGICLNGHSVVYQKSDKVDTQSIKVFLKKLRKKHTNDETIHLIWDNAGYHRSHEVQNFAKKLAIELHYLPPYSPNLNPIERLWKIMHETVTYNKYYPTFADFTDAVSHFFRNISKRKKILQSRITDNFQILNPPKFAS